MGIKPVGKKLSGIIWRGPLKIVFSVLIKWYLMARVPFRYGFTVSDQTFIDREQEMARLKSNLLGGINTILLAPRRWGKSSLVEKTLEQIRQEEAAVKIVHIDLFSAANETEFLQLFARELIKASSNRWEEWMEAGKKFFKRLVPKLSVGNEPFHDFHIGFSRNG